MASKDQEIEIKSAVSKKDFLRIEKYLQDNAKFVKSSKQVDTYYSPKNKLFLKPKYPYEWLSIRDRNNKAILNYKHWCPEGVSDTTHCDECETDLGSKNQAHKLLLALKFEKLVTVEKERRIFVKNNLEVSLDNLKFLGYFVEIESLDNKGGIRQTRKRILEFAKKLGFKKIVHIPGGYAAELMRKKGLMK